MTWPAGPYPERFELPDLHVAFVPLTPDLVDADHAAVMRDIEMLRAWSGQDWPTPTFTAADNLVDLVRHDREQREGIALTYSLLVHDVVQGCVYVHPFGEALRTRGIDPGAALPVHAADSAARGWAHDIDAGTLIAASLRFLASLPLGAGRLWWQTNSRCPAQLAACDRLGLSDALEFPLAGVTWSMRSAPVVTVAPAVPA